MLQGFFERYRLAIREARFIRVSTLLAFGLNFLNWIVVLWFVLPRLSKGSDFYALHYTVYFGVDRIGPAWRLGATPLLGTAALLLNLSLAVRFYLRDRLTAAFLTGLSLLLSALLLASSVLVILNNI